MEDTRGVRNKQLHTHTHTHKLLFHIQLTSFLTGFAFKAPCFVFGVCVFVSVIAATQKNGYLRNRKKSFLVPPSPGSFDDSIKILKETLN
jgi:hypothetical protein